MFTLRDSGFPSHDPHDRPIGMLQLNSRFLRIGLVVVLSIVIIVLRSSSIGRDGQVSAQVGGSGQFPGIPAGSFPLGGEPCERQCDIFAVLDVASGAFVQGIYRINVCLAPTVPVLVVPMPNGGPYNAAAAPPDGVFVGFGGGAPFVHWDLGTGVLSTTGAEPNALVNSFSEAEPKWYEGRGGGPPGDLYGGPVTSLALKGNGGNGYGGDLAYWASCDDNTPLLGAVNIGAFPYLMRVNRTNGAQRLIGSIPSPGAIQGLAFDGLGRLWATDSTGAIGRLNIATGGFTIYGFLPFVPKDLASSPRCNGCAGVPGVGDLGDAPDSSNHGPTAAMTAYPGVVSLFPTVYDPAVGVPSGPIHWFPLDDAWLGVSASQEHDADLTPDDDSITNIMPSADIADLDYFDDGPVFGIHLQECDFTTFQYVVSVTGPSMMRFSNVWFDFNRNGQWGDQVQCVDPVSQQTVIANEWATQNQATSLGAGQHVINVPQFRSTNPHADLWMRIGLSEVQATSPDGSGPVTGYEFGETEDFLLAEQRDGEYEPD